LGWVECLGLIGGLVAVWWLVLSVFRGYLREV